MATGSPIHCHTVLVANKASGPVHISQHVAVVIGVQCLKNERRREGGMPSFSAVDNNIDCHMYTLPSFFVFCVPEVGHTGK